jgi:hypothetical protein
MCAPIVLSYCQLFSMAVPSVPARFASGSPLSFAACDFGSRGQHYKTASCLLTVSPWLLPVGTPGVCMWPLPHSRRDFYVSDDAIYVSCRSSPCDFVSPVHQGPELHCLAFVGKFPGLLGPCSSHDPCLSGPNLTGICSRDPCLSGVTFNPVCFQACLLTFGV